MAERKAKEIKAILREIEKLDSTTLRVAQNVIRLVGTDDLDRLRDELTKRLLPVAKVGANSAAELGAATYNRWRAQDLGQKTKAVVASAYDEGKFMSAINAAVKKAELGGTMEEMLATLSGRIGYTSRTSYSRSLFQSGKADSKKPQYARVPEDEEACQFCMMLASRGFEYSRGSLGDDVHNHANCRCTYVCSWDEDPKAQGYDDREWYDRWQDSIDQEAEERAERNDTTVEEERKAIMQRYSNQASRSREAAKSREDDAQALSPRYLNNQTALYRNVENMEPLPGFEDVAIHSDGWSFSYTDANGDDSRRSGETDVSAKELADMLRENPNYNGGDIRLVACSAGRFEEGAAQQLADELGVNVLAPDKDVFVYPDGKVILAQNEIELDYIVEGKIPETGQWLTFEPRVEG